MKTKPKKFETLSHGPFKGDIRLDSQSGIFSCEYGGDQFADTNVNQVRAWARERLRRLSSLEWIPVLRVSFDEQDKRVNNLKNCTNLECFIERYHIAWEGKKWVQCPWVVMPRSTWMCSGPAPSEMEQSEYPMSEAELMEQRIAHAKDFHYALHLGKDLSFPLVLPGTYAGSTSVYHVRYTQETWNTMLGIIDKIRELRASIGKLLTSTEGWERLALVAQTKLLKEPES